MVQARSTPLASDFLGKVIDACPCLIFVKDREGRFVLVNQATAGVYGTTPAELVGRTDADFNPNAAEVDAFRRDDLEVIDTLCEKVIPEEVVTDARGRTLTLQTVKRPLVDADGVARHVLGVATDVTALKETEARRRELETQVQHAQKLESLGVLAGGIAHDFNNLLVGILANADLLRADLSAGSEAAASLEQILAAAQHAADLCRQLLAYSGRGRFAIEPVDVSWIVQEMTDLLALSVSKKAQLRFELAADLPSIEADATQIRQVVVNLVANASDALGGRPGTITVATRLSAADEPCATPPCVEIVVTDDGSGMDAATQARIFDPFFSTRRAGRGLGLAAVQGIVRGHGGAIHVDSEPGVGTRVRVHLPVTRMATDGDAAPRPRPRADTTVAAIPAGPTVLVVDDDAAVRSVVRRILLRHGVRVVLAADGRHALDVLARDAGGVGLVLLDLTMPHLGGDETLAEIRRMGCDVPVVLMSGYDEQETARRFAGMGLTDFLQKPFRSADLERVVGRHLALRGTSAAPDDEPTPA